MKLSRLIIAAFLPLLLAGAVHAQNTTAYSNTTTFLGQGFAQGGAATTGGNTLTTMVADDLTYNTALAGLPVGSFTFSVANFNATAVSARALVRFYNSDGANGGPGTFLTGFNFNPISFTAGSVGRFTFTQANMFLLPLSGTIWAGISFDNNTGATGATIAQMNNLGQGLFNPPTVGTSQDAFFQTTSPGSFAANNPTGGFLFFGGSPVANFGWQITVAAPEPGSLALLALGVFGGMIARRRRSAGQ